MPIDGTTYARVQHCFLAGFTKGGTAFRKLEVEQRYIFLCLWVHCAHCRRDWFSRDYDLARTLSDHYALDLDQVLITLETGVKLKLIRRTRGQTYVVPGVRAMHAKLHGWCPPYGHHKVPKERKGKERKEQQSTGGVGSSATRGDQQAERRRQIAALRRSEETPDA